MHMAEYLCRYAGKRVEAQLKEGMLVEGHVENRFGNCVLVVDKGIFYGAVVNWWDIKLITRVLS